MTEEGPASDWDQPVCSDPRLRTDGGRDDEPFEPETELEQSQLEAAREFIDGHGYLSWLGLTLEAAAPGRVKMRIPWDEKLVNPTQGEGRNLHGGIAATAVDTSSGFALRTTFDEPESAGLATIDLNLSYLRPATDDLLFDARVVRAGRSVGVTDVIVESTKPDGERVEVAVGRASYRLFRGVDK
ncbi:MAG: PaaI family thioesterase [Halobacteriales archaeon]|nr:PaaI family thioesterase [Halobacteriales archaeon]